MRCLCFDLACKNSQVSLSKQHVLKHLRLMSKEFNKDVGSLGSIYMKSIELTNPCNCEKSLCRVIVYAMNWSMNPINYQIFNRVLLQGRSCSVPKYWKRFSI